jgi:hypothetical protein
VGFVHQLAGELPIAMTIALECFHAGSFHCRVDRSGSVGLVRWK